MNDPISALGEPDEPRPSVLLVEDDAGLREAMTRALTRAGYDVLPAATGAEALELDPPAPPAAAILDVFLPDAGGLGVARVLRRRPELGQVPLLFTTALDLPVVREALSPSPVLFKPFTARQLLDAVQEIARR
jgi:two-component system, OmpR family, response regulator